MNNETRQLIVSINRFPGKHQYRFNQEGKFYFISNCVDKACQIFLGLTVEVNSAINKVGTAFVTLANRTVSCG